MITIIKLWILSFFTKPDYIKCDEIVKTFGKLVQWKGIVGDSISYIDDALNQSILTIKLTKNDVKFFLNPLKKDLFNTIKLNNLNKKERIYIYQNIEALLMEKSNAEIEEYKIYLLKRVGLTEKEFAFLVSTSKDKI